jgi:hypothetical protein
MAKHLLADDPIIAVGEIADDQRCRVDASRRGNGQCVHIGDCHAVEFAGGVLVERFSIIVDLRDFDGDAVFVGPFLDDAGVRGIGAWHPST